MPRQFIGCRFVKSGAPVGRAYHYHWDGPPVAVGDIVKLPGKNPDDGWQRGEVAAIIGRAPPFETKAILGIIPGQASAAPQGDLFGGVTKAPSTAPAPPYVHRRRKTTPYLGGGTGRNPNRLDGEFVDHRARLRDPDNYRSDADEDAQSMMDRDRE